MSHDTSNGCVSKIDGMAKYIKRNKFKEIKCLLCTKITHYCKHSNNKTLKNNNYLQIWLFVIVQICVRLMIDDQRSAMHSKSSAHSIHAVTVWKYYLHSGLKKCFLNMISKWSGQKFQSCEGSQFLHSRRKRLSLVQQLTQSSVWRSR